eukprot:TRINITY_DN4055_c0_g1_i1.p1 TRINITY_DN4055_c0_g1~~TRINITY_DN4055_c0_g1_i1.p1  ORF type:complete len:373 (+),score=45.82 TRINITY_DN4055_c0_g1_i1:97-1119(+)
MAGVGQNLSWHEGNMRKAIEWLLALDPKERAHMEQAVNYVYTKEKPAPQVEAKNIKRRSQKNVMLTLQAGCTEAVQALLTADPTLNPALMNFAHGYNCGGGFEHSAGSQEEDIFRKTSAFLSLWPHRRADDGPGVLARGMWIGDFDEALARKDPFYPHTDCGGIYTPHARLIRQMCGGRRGDELHPADKVAELPILGVLTVAAQDVNREPHFDQKLLREKLRTTLWMAFENGHDAVVLGAFGCGYFRNPPDVVADTFQELLTGEFAGCFRVCAFAIPDRKGPNLEHFIVHFPMVDEAELKVRLAEVANNADAEVGANAKGHDGQSGGPSGPTWCCWKRRW